MNMTMDARPRLKRGVTISQDWANGHKAFHKSTTIDLTDSALAILKKADGTRTLQEISQEIGREMIEAPHQADEVADFLYLMISTGILELH